MSSPWSWQIEPQGGMWCMSLINLSLNTKRLTPNSQDVGHYGWGRHPSLIYEKIVGTISPQPRSREEVRFSLNSQVGWPIQPELVLLCLSSSLLLGCWCTVLVHFIQTFTMWAMCMGFYTAHWIPGCHIPPPQLIPSDTRYLPQWWSPCFGNL